LPPSFHYPTKLSEQTSRYKHNNFLDGHGSGFASRAADVRPKETNENRYWANDRFIDGPLWLEPNMEIGSVLAVPGLNCARCRFPPFGQLDGDTR